MGFKVHESNGNWAVSRDGDGIQVVGTEIGYTLYKELQDKPHEAEKHFRLDKNGKPELKPIEEKTPKAHD